MLHLQELTIMSKLIKTILISGYACLLIQYLKISLAPVIDEIDIEYIIHTPMSIRKREKEFIKFKTNFTAFEKQYKKPRRFKTDLKYVLKYTNSYLHYGTSLYKNGQRAFIENNCTYVNCYLTNNKNLLNDFRDYEAILFDVENNWDGLLVLREAYQKFIFMASESAAHYPLCDEFYDHYYNLTWTYKLDSDIRWSYLNILDMKGNLVGPKIDMKWIDPMLPTPMEVTNKFTAKKKAAAWFVSNCNSDSGRQLVAKNIEKELKKLNLTLDTYGWCGRQSCPKDRLADCLDLLETEYYFYFAFENSLSEDYVTEKILYPLQHYTVPVVYGGANYSRFLPPDSYLNARELSPSQLAAAMLKAIQNPGIYASYFRWHNHYKYVKTPPVPDVCELCRILNEEADKRQVIKYFRAWWNPDFFTLCTHGIGRFLLKKRDFFGILEIIDKTGMKAKKKTTGNVIAPPFDFSY